jgi:activator of HSP90 ATPase
MVFYIGGHMKKINSISVFDLKVGMPVLMEDGTKIGSVAKVTETYPEVVEAFLAIDGESDLVRLSHSTNQYYVEVK